MASVKLICLGLLAMSALASAHNSRLKHLGRGSGLGYGSGYGAPSGYGQGIGLGSPGPGLGYGSGINGLGLDQFSELDLLRELALRRGLLNNGFQSDPGSSGLSNAALESALLNGQAGPDSGQFGQSGLGSGPGSGLGSDLGSGPGSGLGSGPGSGLTPEDLALLRQSSRLGALRALRNQRLGGGFGRNNGLGSGGAIGGAGLAESERDHANFNQNKFLAGRLQGGLHEVGGHNRNGFKSDTKNIIQETHTAGVNDQGFHDANGFLDGELAGSSNTHAEIDRTSGKIGAVGGVIGGKGGLDRGF